MVAAVVRPGFRGTLSPTGGGRLPLCARPASHPATPLAVLTTRTSAVEAGSTSGYCNDSAAATEVAPMVGRAKDGGASPRAGVFASGGGAQLVVVRDELTEASAPEGRGLRRGAPGGATAAGPWYYARRCACRRGCCRARAAPGPNAGSTEAGPVPTGGGRGVGEQVLLPLRRASRLCYASGEVGSFLTSRVAVLVVTGTSGYQLDGRRPRLRGRRMARLPGLSVLPGVAAI